LYFISVSACQARVSTGGIGPFRFWVEFLARNESGTGERACSIGMQNAQIWAIAEL